MFDRLTAFAVLILIAAFSVPEASHADESTQKAVLVTGASTGIGRNIAETPAILLRCYFAPACLSTSVISAWFFSSA